MTVCCRTNMRCHKQLSHFNHVSHYTRAFHVFHAEKNEQKRICKEERTQDILKLEVLGAWPNME